LKIGDAISTLTILISTYRYDSPPEIFTAAIYKKKKHLVTS